MEVHAKEEVDELAQLSGSLSKLSVSERILVGSYSWMEKSSIVIPGQPKILKPNWKKIYVGKIEERPMEQKDIHPNSYFHPIYFEPLEEVLKYEKEDASLKDYDLVTDRNNIRKIDAALIGSLNDYSDFEIHLRKHDNLIIAKRIEKGSNGHSVGKDFEEMLVEPGMAQSCHVIVEVPIQIEGKARKILVRSEVDSYLPFERGWPSVSGMPFHNTQKDLKVHTYQQPKGMKKVRLDSIREIKMSGQLKERDHFQSWIAGITSIVHGVNPRYRRDEKVEEMDGFSERLSNAVGKILSYGKEMKEGKTYKIWRKDSKLNFEEVEDDTIWTASLG